MAPIISDYLTCALCYAVYKVNDSVEEIVYRERSRKLISKPAAGVKRRAQAHFPFPKLDYHSSFGSLEVNSFGPYRPVSQRAPGRTFYFHNFNTLSWDQFSILCLLAKRYGFCQQIQDSSVGKLV